MAVEDEGEQLEARVDVGAEVDVAIVEQGGLVLLQGPHAAIERLIAGDAGLSRATRVTPAATGASGALAKMGTLLPTAGSAPQLFELDATGRKLFEQGQLANKGEGWMRLFGRASDGTITAHGALRPLAIAPQELLIAQMAMTTLALTASIKAVQEAVERVEDKVDLLQDLLDSDRVGQIVGAHQALRRRAERVGFDGSLSDTDWHAIDDIGIEVEQQIESLRSFVRKRLISAEDQGERISGRRDALDDVRELSEALAMVIIAQDSLFLFQQLRLTRIRDAEPHRLPSALEEARQLMDEHEASDRELLERVREVVAARVTVKALEIHRVFTARSVVGTAADVDGMLTWFGSQRALEYQQIDIPELPGVDDAVDELRSRAGRFVGSSRQAVGRLRDRQPEVDPGEEADSLGTGEPMAALKTGDGAEAGTEPEGNVPMRKRLRSLRDRASERLQRGGDDE